jgi:hypothetical protein
MAVVLYHADHGLLPALYVMLAVVLAGGSILLPPRALRELGHTAVALHVNLDKMPEPRRETFTA